MWLGTSTAKKAPGSRKLGCLVCLTSGDFFPLALSGMFFFPPFFGGGWGFKLKPMFLLFVIGISLSLLPYSARP